jgi:hypothetical protein
MIFEIVNSDPSAHALFASFGFWLQNFFHQEDSDDGDSMGALDLQSVYQENNIVSPSSPGDEVERSQHKGEDLVIGDRDKSTVETAAES